MYFSRNYFTISKKQLFEIGGVLFVFPIAYACFRLTNPVFTTPLLKLIGGTALTLTVHILVQLIVFRSRIWMMAWTAFKKRVNRVAA
jgi:prolipoprotein diacylglyceryltransferase